MSGPAVPDVVLQARGVGALEALRGGLPAWATEAFAAVTHLGDTWLLLTLAVVIYLAYDRRDGGFVAAALFVGFAVTILAKAGLALPRPPTELRYVAESGYGFPSGHAVTATVGWGAAAVVLDRLSSARRRAALAGTVVVGVAVSRVAIGVHYLVDVVAGVVLGLAVLGVAVRWGRDEPLALFGLAGGLAGAAAAFAGAGVEAVVVLGAVAGTVPAWQVADPADRPWGAHGPAAGAVLGGLGVGVLAAVDPVAALAFGGSGAVAAAVTLGPAARARVVATGPRRGA